MDEQQRTTRGERILAVACLVGAAVIAFMAVDVLTGVGARIAGQRLATETEAHLRDAAPRG